MTTQATIITGTELRPSPAGDRPGLAIYWMGTHEDPRRYGICFEGAHVNIDRQSTAESIALAVDVVADAVDPQDK